MTEVRLEGGRTTAGVVKVDDTVRRPIGKHSDFVHRLLDKLAELDFPYAPKFLGVDDRGREILTFVAGEVPKDLGDFSLQQISQGGSILRALHDATAGNPGLCGSEQAICHGDASPCNYVFQDSRPVSLIDFDAAFAGPKHIDFGYGCWLWCNLGSNQQGTAELAGKLEAYMLGYDEPPLASLDAMAAAQSWLMDKLTSEQRPELQPAIRWVASCQQWLVENRSELRKHLV